ncbi:hypothetical protein [Labrys neptuniae]|uniref:Uncharacterized protein n=1 Tax=Labrys neptuniae TaxID=376174 RepID=A0ABV3PV15_9HYPH
MAGLLARGCCQRACSQNPVPFLLAVIGIRQALSRRFERYSIGLDFGIESDAVSYCCRIAFAKNRHPLFGTML